MPCPLNSLCAIYHVPLQVIAPGKKLEITLSNQLGPNEGEAEEASATPPLNGFHSPNTTNLHLHGLHVSPAAPADDVETPLEPGNQRAFSYQLPDEHPSGTYWYPLLNPHFRSFPLFSSPGPFFLFLSCSTAASQWLGTRPHPGTIPTATAPVRCR